MTSDKKLQRAVEDELYWEPEVDATDIAVAVTDGLATLTGFVRSYVQKSKAENAVKRLRSVRGVANHIEVRLPVVHQRPAPYIARDSVYALRHELPYVSEQIEVVIKDGWVTLEGNLEWQNQREKAEAAVRKVRGVKGVTNAIKLAPRIEPSQIKEKIARALLRGAEPGDKTIQVEANGCEIIRSRVALARQRKPA